jgi:hypothetical protein
MSTNTDDSFTSAWSKARFPDENRSFVKSFCDEIGIDGFQFVPADYRYIAATRRDGTGELRIHWGCTTGFTEEEAQRLRPHADVVRPSSTRKKTWLVSHPEHRDVDVRGAASGSGGKPKAGMCPRCGIYEMSVTGLCQGGGCDDDA